MINIEKIEEARIKAGFSKYAMSKMIGLSKQSYYDILRKKSTTIDTLVKIGMILDIDKKDLLL